MTSSGVSNLGWATHRLESSATARRHLDHAVDHFRNLGFKTGLLRTLQYAAGVARDIQNDAAATRECVESLDLAAVLGDDHRLAAAFDGIATTAVIMGCPDQAARFFGVSERIRDQLGGRRVPPPLDRASHRHGVDAIRMHLGEAIFNRALDDGRKLNRASAIGEAREFSTLARLHPGLATDSSSGATTLNRAFT